MIGDEKKDRVVTLRVTEQTFSRLRERAAAERRHRGELARIILESALDPAPPPAPTPKGRRR